MFSYFSILFLVDSTYASILFYDTAGLIVNEKERYKENYQLFYFMRNNFLSMKKGLNFRIKEQNLLF